MQKMHTDTFHDTAIWIIWLFVAVAFSGCVSFAVGSKVEKAKDVTYAPPPSPFVRFFPPEADAAWINPETGNSISFLSTCRERRGVTLAAAQKEMLLGIDELRIVEISRKGFMNQEALLTHAKGRIDGAMTEFEFVVFKKMDCIYSVSYAGRDPSFEMNLSDFYRFLKNFRTSS